MEMISFPEAAKVIRALDGRHEIKVLNVVRPRESKDMRIYSAVMELLETMFDGLSCPDRGI